MSEPREPIKPDAAEPRPTDAAAHDATVAATDGANSHNGTTSAETQSAGPDEAEIIEIRDDPAASDGGSADDPPAAAASDDGPRSDTPATASASDPGSTPAASDPAPNRMADGLLPSIEELEAAQAVADAAPARAVVRHDAETSTFASAIALGDSDGPLAAGYAPPSGGGRGGPRGVVETIVRPTLYVVSLLAILISLAPFTDRSGKAVISTLEIGSRINQIFFPSLLIALLFAVGINRLHIFKPFLRWPYVAFVLWLIPTTALSLDPALSARRTAFFLIQVAIALLALVLPRSERQFALMLAIVASTVIIASYAGVAFLPQLSIHQLTDAIETELAGNWRGIFRHKNEAGAVMVMLVFVGLFVARALNLLVGATIAILATAFLVFSVSKSSMILLPVCLTLAFLVERARTTKGRAFAAFTLLIAFNVATLGSSFPGPIRTNLVKIMPDVTFTGRTDLWRYAMEHVAKSPLVGYGIGAFWRTGATMYKDRETNEPEDASGWVAELGTDSHNGYLDVAVSTGLPGALLLIISIVLLPLRDIAAALRQPGNRLMTRFYIRCWVFVLYLSSVESLLMPLNPIWYIMLQSVFGLLLLAHYRVQRD